MMGANNFDLVICEWNMEPMTGYELLRHMHTAIGRIPLHSNGSSAAHRECGGRKRRRCKWLHCQAVRRRRVGAQD